MGQMHNEIPENVMDWIPKQHIFWVASAPLSADGHINISPKGVAGTFHVVNSRRVWYEDLSGTGAETVAHIRENGRVTILFNAFEGPPRIVRLYGKGSVYEIGTPEYDALLPMDKRQPGSRAVIALDVFKVATTCGYAVPYYQFLGHRNQLNDWAAKREAADVQDENASGLHLPTPHSPLSPSASLIVPQDPNTYNSRGMKHWWMNRNVTSLDGLPAFNFARNLLFGLSTPKSDEPTSAGGKAASPTHRRAHASSVSASAAAAIAPTPTLSTTNTTTTTASTSTTSPTQPKHQHRRPLTSVPSIGASTPNNNPDDILLRPFQSALLASSNTHHHHQLDQVRTPSSRTSSTLISPLGHLLLAFFGSSDNDASMSVGVVGLHGGGKSRIDLMHALGSSFQKALPLFLAFVLGILVSQMMSPIFHASHALTLQASC